MSHLTDVILTEGSWGGEVGQRVEAGEKVGAGISISWVRLPLCKPPFASRVALGTLLSHLQPQFPSLYMKFMSPCAQRRDEL